eukprot:GEMP01021262.1.p3 GENE.GEMP01021262.1~~GEMP01021262.1.p3  ORF type:complete len:182 (+),score=32.47 GEMP01021262.1:436-981(+)
MAYGLEPMRRVTYAPDITEPLGSLFEELVTGRNSQIRKLVDFLASGKTERWAGGMAQITLLVNGKSDATEQYSHILTLIRCDDELHIYQSWFHGYSASNFYQQRLLKKYPFFTDPAAFYSTFQSLINEIVYLRRAKARAATVHLNFLHSRLLGLTFPDQFFAAGGRMGTAGKLGKSRKSMG